MIEKLLADYFRSDFWARALMRANLAQHRPKVTSSGPKSAEFDPEAAGRSGSRICRCRPKLVEFVPKFGSVGEDWSGERPSFPMEVGQRLTAGEN